MQASVRRLLCSALTAFATACVGSMSINLPPSPDDNPSETAPPLDAGDGKDGGRDARGRQPSACPDQPYAKGLRIRELALYQTVKIVLFNEGTWIDASDRSAAIVSGKQGLVRAMVDVAGDGYTPHAVRAVLRLKDGDNVSEIEEIRTLAGPSDEQELASSFNFNIKPGQIGLNTELSVSLEEPNCDDESGSPAETRVPVTGGYQLLEAADIKKLHVVLVPIENNGLLPDVSQEKREELRKTLLAYYPVPDVEITVRDRPLQWATPVAPDNTGTWLNLLNQVHRERQVDAPEEYVYYVGVVQPMPSYELFCDSGCVLGIAMQAPRRQASAQVALTASFPDQTKFDSFVHELGHTHGRQHAPCSPGGELEGIDKSYPLRTGAVESWGWDFRTKKLIAPESHMDIMGYCEPHWISTYTYAALAERSLQVNGDFFIKNGPGQAWESMLFYGDGKARWGGASEVGFRDGETEPAEALDASGKVVANIRVMRIPLSHTTDQFGYVPRPAASWSSIRLRDREIKLADVLPPIKAGTRGAD